MNYIDILLLIRIHSFFQIPCFLPNAFFSVLGFHPRQDITFECEFFPQAPFIYDNFLDCHFFLIWMVCRRIAQVQYWDLVIFFLCLQQGYVFGKEKNTGKVPFKSHHNKGRYYKHKLTLFMLTLITRLRQHLPSFSTLKFFFPHFLYCSIQKKVTVAAHTEEMGIYAQIP